MTRSTVLHLTDSEELGGAERQLATLIGHLDPGAWESVFVHTGAPGVRPLVEELRAGGIADRRMPAMPDGARGAVRAAAFARELRRLRPTVVHAHLTWPLAMKWPIAAAIAARVPVVVATVQLYLPFLTDRRILWQQREIARRIGRYLAVSRAVAEDCRRTCGWPAERLTVVYNGIEPAPFERGRRAPTRAALGIGDDEPLVLTPARLDPQKGLDVLVRAAAQVGTGARFAIAGEGPLRDELTRQIAAAGLRERVVLLGRRTDVPDLLAAADLVVLPSRQEGLPVSLVEAMAASRPVVATRIPGTDELVRHDVTGLLVPVDDDRALSSAITAVLADPGLARRLGAAGRERALTHFTARAMADAVARVYEEELARRGGHS